MKIIVYRVNKLIYKLYYFITLMKFNTYIRHFIKYFPKKTVYVKVIIKQILKLLNSPFSVAVNLISNSNRTIVVAAVPHN